MNLSDFNYDYPEDLIATHPLPDRDASRMMVLNRADEGINHSHVKDIPSFLKKGDLLVVNNTRVFPARLIGKKESGGYFEILLLGQVVIPAKAGISSRWRCITNQTKTSRPGLKILFGTELVGTIISREGEELIIEFNRPELIEEVGLPPVPPYIRARRCHCEAKPKQSPADDKARYQTIYARHTGSAAAPTAGLHFSERLLEKVKAKGVDVANVTLHVGLDTFSPVREEDILKHKIHGEEYLVPDETVAAIERAKANGGRVIAVGTTSVRALESFACHCEERERRSNPVHEIASSAAGGLAMTTHLFIYPGYKFRVVDAILTNFHQPKSTLLMLVSAFAGRDFILRAYEEAIREKYRLFSYGDCMLIV